MKKIKKLQEFLIKNNKKIIIIEGLDCAGKETLAKKIQAATNGIIIDFPRYETKLGKVIKDKLHSGNKEGIAELFEQDRKLFWKKDIFNIKEETIIFDRLHHCNLAYNEETSMKEEMWFRYLRLNDWVNCKVAFILREAKGKSRDLHESYINKREVKDKNETIEFQDKINDRYWNLIENKKIEFKSQDIILQIGTDFDEMIKRILQ